MAVLALLSISVFILPPSPRIVATLTDTLNAQWVDTPAPMQSGAALLNDGRPLRLLNGLAEVEFNHGALLVLEGPSIKQTLVAGQARAVDAAGTIEEIKIEDDFFVRQFSSETGRLWRGQRIDLADIVGGGNGLGTGQLTCGVDCRTGEFVTDRSTDEISFTPDYQPVPTNPYIDGAFLPYPDGRPVRISSKQHVFAECPPYNELGKYCIFNGYRKLEEPRHLRGIDYRGGPRPYIDMHSTLGITFDLRVIRSLVRGMDKRLTLKRFRAHTGIAQETIDVIRQQGKTGSPHADLWVLVDGQVRAQQVGLDPSTSAIPIEVKLLPKDAFLTLVVTDGGDDGSWDWVLLVDPVLDIGY